MSPVPIRPAEIRDAEAMAKIAAANPTAPQWTAAQFAEMLQPRPASGMLCRTVLVGESAGEIGGFAVVSAVCAVFPADAELESLAVAPTLQGLGIGRALLLETFAWASAQGAESLRLEVRASNDRALRVYRLAGFRQIGERPGYYAAPLEDAVVMERTLEDLRGGLPTHRLA